MKPCYCSALQLLGEIRATSVSTPEPPTSPLQYVVIIIIVMILKKKDFVLVSPSALSAIDKLSPLGGWDTGI